MLELFFVSLKSFPLGRLKITTHEIIGFVVLSGDPVPTTLMIGSSPL